jgi:hypothetical protein
VDIMRLSKVGFAVSGRSETPGYSMSKLSNPTSSRVRRKRIVAGA